MTDDRQKPLGLIPLTPQERQKMLSLTTVLTASGLNPPPNGMFDFTDNMPVGWDDFGNNSIGDCVEAAVLHYIMTQTNANGRLIKSPSTAGVTSYSEITGYIKGTGVGPGTSPSAAMSYWRHKGFPTMIMQPAQIINPFNGQISGNTLTVTSQPPYPIQISNSLTAAGTSGLSIKANAGGNGGIGNYTLNQSVPSPIANEPMNTKYSPPVAVQARDRIKAYMMLDAYHIHGDHSLVIAALWNFIGGCVTVMLPKAWQGQATWDGPPPNTPQFDPLWTPGTWGGHWVYVVAVNAIGPVIITWGNKKQVTWAGWDWAFTDAWVALSVNDIDPVTLLGPTGLDMTALNAWLAANGSPVTS